MARMTSRIAEALRDLYSALYEDYGIAPTDFARIVMQVLKDSLQQAYFDVPGNTTGWVRVKGDAPDEIYRVVKDFAEPGYGYIAPDLWAQMYPGMRESINVVCTCPNEADAQAMVRSYCSGRLTAG